MASPESNAIRIDNLSEKTNQIEKTVQSLEHEVLTDRTDYTARLAILEQRVDKKQEEINRLEKDSLEFRRDLSSLRVEISELNITITELTSIFKTYKSIIYALFSVFGLAGVTFIAKLLALI